MNFDPLTDSIDPALAVFRLATPVLLICVTIWLGRCLAHLANVKDASRQIEPSHHRTIPGAAEGPSTFRHDASEALPWFLTNWARGVAFCMTLGAGAMAIALGCNEFLFEDQISGFRSPDTVKFETIMDNAETNLADGKEAEAKALYMDALNLMQITLVHAAEPMNGVAKILIKEGRFDAAEPLAFVAARLHSNEPAYVNTYAEILIEKCRPSEALDILKGLELEQDFESRTLLEVAEAKTDFCSAPQSIH